MEAARSGDQIHSHTVADWSRGPFAGAAARSLAGDADEIKDTLSVRPADRSAGTGNRGECGTGCAGQGGPDWVARRAYPCGENLGRSRISRPAGQVRNLATGGARRGARTE